jgi:endonuclease YncB( thermonuclease family)
VFQRNIKAHCYKTDRFRRDVCRVYEGQLDGKRDVGLEQIRAGMAWHFKAYQHEQRTEELQLYRDEEEAAKAAKRGLWADAKPVPPWEWRLRSNAKQAI